MPFPGLPTFSGPSDVLKKAIILDTETTGLEPTSAIIELAMLEVYFDPATDDIVGTGRVFHGFEDPQAKLSDEVMRVTGLTDDDLANKHIDAADVADMLKDAALIIAHNAAFDRPRFERRFPIPDDAIIPCWACSVAEIPWKVWGAPSNALQCLAWWAGYHFNAHRATADVEALASLLFLDAPLPFTTGNLPSIFSLLVKSARTSTYRCVANGAAFDTKDMLKARGYSWDAELKRWWKDVVDAQAETEWLKREVKCHPESKPMNARMRYR